MQSRSSPPAGAGQGRRSSGGGRPPPVGYGSGRSLSRRATGPSPPRGGRGRLRHWTRSLVGSGDTRSLREATHELCTSSPSVRSSPHCEAGPPTSTARAARRCPAASPRRSPRPCWSRLSNRGHVSAASRRADQVVLEARAAMADLLGADPRGVVFGRSMTALTYDLARTLARTWSPGDEVVVTRLDHDANIRPWVQAARRSGRPSAGSGSTAGPVSCAPRTCGGAVRAHPPRRRHRRLEPDRHPARPARDRRPGARPVARCSSSTAVHLARTPPVDQAALGADFWPARRTSSSARTAGS